MKTFLLALFTVGTVSSFSVSNEAAAQKPAQECKKSNCSKGSKETGPNNKGSSGFAVGGGNREGKSGVRKDK